jgi:excisionase family DNA binding protein
MVVERLTAEQVAEIIGVSPSTVRSLQRQGRIPHVKPSEGKAYYERAEIERWLDGRRLRAQDVPARAS